MLRVLTVLFLTIAPCASAQIFKWVDAEGRTQFSDRPQTSVESTESAAESAADTDETAAPEEADTKPLLGPYSKFSVLSPGPNKILRQLQDNLDVNLLIAPPMITGQQLELVLDGVPVQTEKTAVTQFTLTGVAFGNHEIAAQIRNILGMIVARTPTVSFQLRKPLPPGVLP